MERININTQTFEFDDVLDIVISALQAAPAHGGTDWKFNWRDLVEIVNDLAGRKEVQEIQSEHPRPRRGGRPKGSKNKPKQPAPVLEPEEKDPFEAI